MLPFEAFVEQSRRAATVPQLKAHFQRIMADEGYDNYFLGTVTTGQIVKAEWASFPEGHFETYLAEGWDRVDPILALAARASGPFCWDRVAPGMRFSRPQMALLHECKRVGVHAISVVPFRNHDGSCEIIGISSRHAHAGDPARMPVLHAMCAQTLWRAGELCRNGMIAEARQAALTAKELEVLKWIKAGKSNTDISDILDLSVKTVEYHVSNILKKLGVSNRIGAVVVAMQHHILSL